MGNHKLASRYPVTWKGKPSARKASTNGNGQLCDKTQVVLVESALISEWDFPARGWQASNRRVLCVCSKFYGQATKSMRGDALAQVGDEGRGQLR